MIKTLYGLDKKGGFKIWTIEVEEPLLEQDVLQPSITIYHGKLGGKMTTKVEFVKEGKQGRSAFEQAVLEAKSLIKKQEDKNYSDKMINPIHSN